MKRHILLCMVLGFLAPIAFAQAGAKIAVVVGVNDYDRLTPLKAAVNDANNMAAHFQAAGYTHVWTLTDNAVASTQRPSLVNFQILMENVEKLSQSEPIAELAVFFAGHGVQIEGENYLCFPETDLQGRRGVLSVDRELVPWLRRVPAKLTLTFLDACRENLGPTRSATVTRGLVLPDNLDAGADRNILIAYSARPGEFAYEKPDGSGGFFTEVLLEGLRKGNQLTVGQLVQFVRTELPQRTQQVFGKVQVPSFGGDFNFDVAFTSTTRMTMLTQSFLKLQTSQPVSELYLNNEPYQVPDDATVAVAPGDYLLRAVSGDTFWEADFSVAGAGTVTVIPDWKPFGQLEFQLPPAAAVELVHSNGTVLLLENSGVVPYMETGSWSARTEGSLYEPWTGSLVVERGKKAFLAPALTAIPGNEDRIRLARAEWEREVLQARLPAATQTREDLWWLPWVAGGTGTLFTAAGAGLWVWSEATYSTYQQTTDSSVAQSSRELVQQLDLWKMVSLGVGAAGLLVWAGHETFNPHPDRFQESIEKLDEEIRQLQEKEK